MKIFSEVFQIYELHRVFKDMAGGRDAEREKFSSAASLLSFGFNVH